jgi:hypothetical protein
MSEIKVMKNSKQEPSKGAEDAIRTWYAKETNREVTEFDDYDLHICRVVKSYLEQYRAEGMGEKCDGCGKELMPIYKCNICDNDE